ncbi:MAG: hypothetical protein K8U57_20485 [Planctomycetes bacterium]|nr:hypothetical protein [Planctomycetota bacterium]
MVTASLILAAVVVILLLVVVIGQMCESGSMWLVHVCCDTPGALCKLLFAILAAILDNATD